MSKKSTTESLAEITIALSDWIDERQPRDVGDCNLMIAFWKLRGDWPGCDNCDHQCDMPCMPITAADAIGNLAARKERLKAKAKGRAVSLEQAAEIAVDDDDYLSTLDGQEHNLQVPDWVPAGWFLTINTYGEAYIHELEPRLEWHIWRSGGIKCYVSERLTDAEIDKLKGNLPKEDWCFQQTKEANDP